MKKRFEGFSPETYDFLMEVRFHRDDRAWFEENRKRYYACVKEPLTLLAEELVPTMADIDPEFNLRLTTVVSRIRRDTRFSRDKSLYRDHAWICFRHLNTAVSEGFCIYFEITPESYGYGMGMYAPNTDVMKRIRGAVKARPDEFLALAGSKGLERFTLEGTSYMRDRFPNERAEIRPYLNMKSMSWCFSSERLKDTMMPGFKDELLDAAADMRPMYTFINGAIKTVQE